MPSATRPAVRFMTSGSGTSPLRPGHGTPTSWTASVDDRVPHAQGSVTTGWLATVVFFGLNGVALEAPDDPAFELVMAVARGEIDHQAIAETLRS